MAAAPALTPALCVNDWLWPQLLLSEWPLLSPSLALVLLENEPDTVSPVLAVWPALWLTPLLVVSPLECPLLVPEDTPSLTEVLLPCEALTEEVCEALCDWCAPCLANPCGWCPANPCGPR